MLPFLRPRSQTGIIVETRKADSETPSEVSELDAVADDLIAAVHAKDKKGVAEALQAAFAILESTPHDETSEFEGEEGTE